MRWVQQAAIRPHRCAVVPFLGNSSTRRGFIDTGQDLPGWDNHVYISVEAVEEMARMVGWTPPGVAAEAQRQTEKANVRVEEHEARIAELEEQLAAVETLRNAGFKSRAKAAA